MTIEAAITFDVEADCPGVADSCMGIRRGLPRLLKVLQQLKLNGTFFVTGDMAERFPRIVRVLAERHEVACHGLTHATTAASSSFQVASLRTVKRILEDVTGQSVEGFRAPRLRLAPALFSALARAGFRYDSSRAWWLPSHRHLAPERVGLAEFRLLLPNVLLRFPSGLRLFQVTCLTGHSPLVLFFHPSEAVAMAPVLQAAGETGMALFRRPDRWVNTGPPFMFRLEQLLRFLLRHRVSFAPLRDLSPARV